MRWSARTDASSFVVVVVARRVGHRVDVDARRDRAIVRPLLSTSARTMSPAAGELSKLLDGDDAANGGADSADTERCERAEMARAQAESDAAEGKRRLEVARQQFAEYATSKAD